MGEPEWLRPPSEDERTIFLAVTICYFFPAALFLYIYKNGTFLDGIRHLETRDRMGEQLSTTVASGDFQTGWWRTC